MPVFRRALRSSVQTYWPGRAARKIQAGLDVQRIIALFDDDPIAQKMLLPGYARALWIGPRGRKALPARAARSTTAEICDDPMGFPPSLKLRNFPMSTVPPPAITVHAMQSMAIRGFIAHNRESGSYTLTASGRATLAAILEDAGLK
jgi:hypothetical protein